MTVVSRPYRAGDDADWVAVRGLLVRTHAHVFIGSVDGLVAKLRELRERLGISSFMTGGPRHAGAGRRATRGNVSLAGTRGAPARS